VWYCSERFSRGKCVSEYPIMAIILIRFINLSICDIMLFKVRRVTHLATEWHKHLQVLI